MTPLKQEYKELYAAELAKREELNNAISQPIAIVTAFGAALFFVFSDFTNPLSYAHLVESVIGVAVAFLLVNATYSIAWSNYDHTYAFAPTPAELETYRAKLTEYHTGEDALAADQIDEKVLAYIYKSYIDAASLNAQINELRSGYLHDARTALIYALHLLLLLGGLKFVTAYFALLR